jgi:hypothetical protein
MKYLLLTVALFISSSAFTQETENVFVIMTDGLRWQEVFSGADSVLLNDAEYTENIDKTTDKFWDESANHRREKLMPFLWSKIAADGQIHGNRNYGNNVDIKNIYGFSYPGYNEVLTGYPDKEIDSNDKKYNKNVTVLEFLNKQKGYEGKVAAFTTWDVFPYIINEPRSGVPVNSGVEIITGENTEGEFLLNDIQVLYPSLASSRHDFVTFFAAKEYVKKNKPKVMFLSFDETDEFAHEGKYREYLYAANTVDGFIKNIWEYCQSQPEYANKTTFIITTDHGRGDAVKSEWRSHGQKVADCRSIWLAAIGPDVAAKGEVKTNGQFYQNQIAQTVANLLGFTYENGHEVGEVINLD